MPLWLKYVRSIRYIVLLLFLSFYASGGFMFLVCFACFCRQEAQVQMRWRKQRRKQWIGGLDAPGAHLL